MTDEGEARIASVHRVALGWAVGIGLAFVIGVGLSTFGGNYEYCAPLEVVGP